MLGQTMPSKLVKYERSHECTHVCICVYMNACLYVNSMYACLYARVYVCVYVCMYVRTYVCLYVCNCIYVCMCMCMDVCMNLPLYELFKHRRGNSATKEYKNRTDATLRSTALILGSKEDLTIGYVESIQAHNPAATAARKAVRRVTARATARATLVVLARKILTPHDIRELTDEQLRNRGFAVRLAGGQKCRLLLSHDIRSWGDQEGREAPTSVSTRGQELEW
jgi:hypothetical protein